MKKITLKLFEIYSLSAEINGVSNQQTQEVVLTGLLKEKLSLKTKFWLTDLSKKVQEVVDTANKLKEDMIKKHGTADKDGNVMIQMFLDEENTQVNPQYQAFVNDFNELLQEDKEIEYKGFVIDEFENIETSENYAIFYKFITAD